MIRPVHDKDVDDIVTIYNYYIAETLATFEEQVISSDDMLARIKKVSVNDLPWLVAEDDSGKVVGYAYATKWRERFAYRFSVEITVYLLANQLSQGLGSKLYTALFSELRQRSIHSVIGGITLPNPASIALHEKFGLKQVAHFKEVGFKFEKWLDVGYWQGKISEEVR
jgi:phosphinothricin acetyltransferase